MTDAPSAKADVPALLPSPAAVKPKGSFSKKPRLAASRTEVVPAKVLIPTGTMSYPFRNIFTQISLRGLRQLSTDIGVSGSLNNEADKIKLEALHGLSVAYNVYNKVKIETAKAFGAISPVGFRAYQPVHTICCAAIEAMSSYKHDSGILVCIDETSTLAQIEQWRAALWEQAYGTVAMPTDQSNFGRLSNIGNYQSALNRHFGREAFRVPSDVTDFSIIHYGYVKIGGGLRQIVGPGVLSQQSELLARVLSFRRYESMGCAFRYVPCADDDFDSIHFTSGVCSGRAWDYHEAFMQLRLAVTASAAKHQIC